MIICRVTENKMKLNFGSLSSSFGWQGILQSMENPDPERFP